ncbi:hypothetical protein GCM10010191_60360 [Actinomadura vinacea]|uniref:Uncharacterized protein n=1 Tax=Actinomadura vinacea TaxID=115336 RepID=A0ABN3JUA7_9ACTN
MAHESMLDPWGADWLKTNARRVPLKDILELARPTESPFPVTRELAHVDDEVAAGIPIRIYRGEGRPMARDRRHLESGHRIGRVPPCTRTSFPCGDWTTARL